jgi:hypothetical protein
MKAKLASFVALLLLVGRLTSAFAEDGAKPPPQPPSVVIHAMANHYFKSFLPQLLGGGMEASYSFITPAPTWVSLTPEGVLVGRPGANDVGTFPLEIAIKEKEIVRSEQLTIEVAKDQGALAAKIVVKAGEPFAKDLKKIFGKEYFVLGLNCPRWLKLSPDGLLVGSPGEKEAGRYTCDVQISSPYEKPELATLYILVTPSTEEPEPVFSVIAGQQLIVDLKRYLPDAQKFMVMPMPDWATLTEDGIFVARPPKEAVGTHTFNFYASVGEGKTKAITVAVRVVERF